MRSTTGNSYARDWRDWARDLANVCFIIAYLVLLDKGVFLGAILTGIGEVLLIPNAIKTKSYTTVVIAGIFIVISIASIL